ncbi:MAG: beta-ketoacyl-ACP synthase II [Bdellovibrio sp.]|nr:beta-ketoacyl-ACP synthase II [Bdellovibrio sp.]
MAKNRVAVTGMGALCGLGTDLTTIWPKLLSGQSGISKIENINTEALPCKIAGEVKNFVLNENVFPAKEAGRYDRFILFAVKAAHEALHLAGLEDLKKNYLPDRMGCILGIGMGGLPEIERTCETFLSKGSRRVSPFFIPAIIPNMAPGVISIQYGLKGVNYHISSACASSTHAITSATYEIESGRHDVIITGGAESVISNLPISGFANMKALSKREDDPTKASRPFDRDRDGFVMGEGAGLLVLENLEKARARGAKIYAEVVGHGASSDAYHITAPHPEGEGAKRCMKLALESGNLKIEQIGHINAHGTSTPLGDIGETKAIKGIFQQYAPKIKICSSKSMTGHLLGAAGGLESIFCIMSLHHGIISPTINLENPDPECDLDYVPNVAQKVQVEYALNNSFGFGGTNASIIFKHFSN